MPAAGAVEGMATPQGRGLVAVPGQVRELDAVIGQDRVDRTGYGGGELEEALPCGARRRLGLQANEGVFRGPVQRHEQVQLAALAESALLANTDDPHRLKVCDPAIKGRTDRFAYRFVKP